MREDVRHSTIPAELAAGRSVTYFTVGTSMLPLLRERQTHATISPLTEARRGDIILYIRKNGALVLHRCIKADDACYYMRGDHTYGLESIRKEQAIGVVTHIYRKDKYFDVQTNAAYKLYAALWGAIYPFRWLMHRCRMMLGRLRT